MDRFRICSDARGVGLDRRRSGWRQKLALLGAALFGFLASTTPAYAAASPDLEIYEVFAYRSLNTASDLVFIVRGELPLGSTSTPAWCAQLTDTEGCELVPVAPTAPTSLPSGLASVTMYSAWDGATGDLEEKVQVPRVDHLLGGLYFGPGHGFAWEDPAIVVCLESSAIAFTPDALACIHPQWEAGTAAGPVSTAQTALKTNIVQMMLNLQYEKLLPQGSLVTQAGKITVTGRIYALEAFPLMDRLIPDVFQAATAQSVLTDDYVPVTADSLLQIQIDADSATSTFVTAMDNLAAAQFGVSGTTLTVLAVLGVGALAAGIVYTGSKSSVLSSFAFFSILIMGTWVRAPTVAVVFTILAILILPTVAYFLTQLHYPEIAVPVGVFRRVEKPTYEQLVEDQIRAAQKDGPGTLEELFSVAETWEVT